MVILILLAELRKRPLSHTTFRDVSIVEVMRWHGFLARHTDGSEANPLVVCTEYTQEATRMIQLHTARCI
jgi:hypothetical protein